MEESGVCRSGMRFRQLRSSSRREGRGPAGTSRLPAPWQSAYPRAEGQFPYPPGLPDPPSLVELEQEEAALDVEQVGPGRFGVVLGTGGEELQRGAILGPADFWLKEAGARGLWGLFSVRSLSIYKSRASWQVRQESFR